MQLRTITFTPSCEQITKHKRWEGWAHTRKTQRWLNQHQKQTCTLHIPYGSITLRSDLRVNPSQEFPHSFNYQLVCRRKNIAPVQTLTFIAEELHTNTHMSSDPLQTRALSRFSSLSLSSCLPSRWHDTNKKKKKRKKKLWRQPKRAKQSCYKQGLQGNCMRNKHQQAATAAVTVIDHHLQQQQQQKQHMSLQIKFTSIYTVKRGEGERRGGRDCKWHYELFVVSLLPSRWEREKSNG